MNKFVRKAAAITLISGQFSRIQLTVAWTILRVVVGIMMIHNGLDKLSNIESFAQAYVAYMGFPFPVFFSYVVALTECIGAPLVAIGLLTRPIALSLFSTMCVAMYHHILVAGLSLPYLELSAVYAACFLFLALNGGGAISMDAKLAQWLRSNTAIEWEVQGTGSLASDKTKQTLV